MEWPSSVTRETASSLVSGQLRYQIVGLELWARMFFAGESAEALGDKLIELGVDVAHRKMTYRKQIGISHRLARLARGVHLRLSSHADPEGLLAPGNMPICRRGAVAACEGTSLATFGSIPGRRRHLKSAETITAAQWRGLQRGRFSSSSMQYGDASAPWPALPVARGQARYVDCDASARTPFSAPVANGQV